MLTSSKHWCNKDIAGHLHYQHGRAALAFPEKLRHIRLGQFLSQAELARRSGVHALTITRLEAGRTAPSTRTVRALARALGIGPGDLATPDEVAEADRRYRQGALRQVGD
jgi:transcriptional regulator with XRE-family HTH domain